MFEETNKRLFDVSVEGNLIFVDYDIVKAAGAKTATLLSTTQAVDDGGLTIRLEKKREHPKISGIEVKRVA